MKIIAHHYADVNNYGDVLFPRLVSMLIRKSMPQAEIQFASASSTMVGSEKSVTIDDIDNEDFDVALIAGGEVVHKYDDMLRQILSRTTSSPSVENPTDVVYRIATRRAHERYWLGVGVPQPSPAAAMAIESSLPGLTHVSVRGHLSDAILKHLGGRPTVIPDLGWLIPELANCELWTQGAEVHALKPKRDYVVFQAIPNLGPYDVKEIAQILTEIQIAHGVDIVLMGITDCWDDSRDLIQINDLADGRFIIVDKTISFETRGALLLECQAFLGQSMHGAITAMAVGHPAIVVHPSGNDQKFRELFAMIGEPGLRTSSWANCLNRFDISMQKQGAIRKFSDHATSALNSYAAALFR